MKWKRDYTVVSGKTLQITTQQWNKYFVPYDITTEPLRYLTPKDFTHLFMKWTRNRQMTAKTFNNLKSIINGVFSYSINELELVNANPVREINMRQFPMKPQKQHTSVFLLDDRERVLNNGLNRSCIQGAYTSDKKKKTRRLAYKAILRIKRICG